MREEMFSGLNVRLTGGLDREGGGTGPVVLLLHGFGAPGDDLVSLWRWLNVPSETRFVFPEAPLELNVGFGDSRAWWMLDMERMARERALGHWRELIREVPRGLQSVREQVIEAVTQIAHTLHVVPEQIILGGFSQGAILACDIVLHTDLPFAGLILMSGTMVAQDEWLPLIPNRKEFAVFQSHGTDDPILSWETAIHLRDTLKNGGLEVQWMEFRGGHEIPLSVLEQESLFIRHRLYHKAE